MVAFLKQCKSSLSPKKWHLLNERNQALYIEWCTPEERFVNTDNFYQPTKLHIPALAYQCYDNKVPNVEITNCLKETDANPSFIKVI